MVLDPSHIVATPVIDTAGNEFTVMAAVAKLLQLFASVPVTVYPVLVVGDTIIAVVVPPPELHTYDVAPPAVNVTAVPAHTVLDIGFAVTVGKGFTVRLVVAVFTQLFISVPVTV